MGTHYTIQYQRAGLAWSSYGEETGSRDRGSARERDILYDLAWGQAYDVRVRWENPNGAGPWTTLHNVPMPGGGGQGPPVVERIERNGDKVWIFFTRDLDVGRPIGGIFEEFEVHYSESKPIYKPGAVGVQRYNSWRRAEFVNERNAAQACTSSDLQCRIVRLTLPTLERGGRPAQRAVGR